MPAVGRVRVSVWRPSRRFSASAESGIRGHQTDAVYSPVGLDVKGFLRFVSASFRQKRKTLRNNLAGSYPRERLDKRPEISQRAEQLSVDEFIGLYQGLEAE